MRCYYVLVHGALDWAAPDCEVGELGQPDGFYCHRFVLAQTEADAAQKAFRRVRENLDRETGWLRRGLVHLTLEAEDLSIAPVLKLLIPENRGHTFYRDE